MTRFEDGPAKGQTLMLKRAPYFLRVVLSPKGKWDALDQLDDKPDRTETLFAYELIEAPGVAFLNPGGRYPVARYRLVENQPIDGAMRDSEAWPAWVETEAKRKGLQ